MIAPDTVAAPNLAEAEAALAEAVDTLRRLPAVRVRSCLTLWPAIVQASHEAYGYADTRARPAPASPEAITRLDHVLEALRRLETPDRRLVWSRANGFSWRRIAGFVGAAPNTCRARYLAALARFAAAYEAPANRPGP
jgi:hypothetical protein